MQIFSEWVGKFLWSLVCWKTDILGYNILIETNLELRTEHWEERDQS